MRPAPVLVAGCLLLAAAPAQPSIDGGPAVLEVTAHGVAEAMVEFTEDVVVNGDPSSAYYTEAGAWDIPALTFETEDAFAAVALVQETADPDTRPLELIAGRTTAFGHVDEFLSVNGRDREGSNAWTLDAGRYRLFVLSASPASFRLELAGLSQDIVITATQTTDAGLLGIESRNPTPLTRHWSALHQFDTSATALVHTWEHSGDDVTHVRATSRCRITAASDPALTWLPGCPTGRAPSGGEGPDLHLLTAGGSWATSFHYPDPHFDPTVGASWSVTQDPGSTPVSAGMVGVWWSRAG